MDLAFPEDHTEIPAATLSDEDNSMQVWETFGGREIARLVLDQEVDSFEFSPDGQYLFTVNSQGNRAYLWRPIDLIQAVQGRLTRSLTKEEKDRHLSITYTRSK